MIATAPPRPPGTPAWRARRRSHPSTARTKTPETARQLTGQRITEELAAKASDASVTGARALSKNAYKIPLTRGVVRRAILEARG